MMSGEDNVLPESRRSTMRAAVIGAAVLALILMALTAGFLLDRVNRRAVGVVTPSAIAGRRQASGGSTAPTTSPVVLQTEADVSRLRTPLEQDIARAYFRYWAVYAAAMETLDATRLPEVTVGGRLEEAMAEVSDVKADGVAAKIQVSHNVSIVQVGDTEATVRDEYKDTSYAIQPVTRAAVGTPGPSSRTVNAYFLRRIDGAWKVIGGRRGG
jgi:hypothetical protein